MDSRVSGLSHRNPAASLASKLSKRPARYAAEAAAAGDGVRIANVWRIPWTTERETS